MRTAGGGGDVDGGGPVDAGGAGGEGRGGAGDGVRSRGIGDDDGADAAAARLGPVDLAALAFDAGTRLRPLSIDADDGAALAEMFGCGAAATGAAGGAGTAGAGAGVGTAAAGVGTDADLAGSGADEGSGCLVAAVGPLAR